MTITIKEDQFKNKIYVSSNMKKEKQKWKGSQE